MNRKSVFYSVLGLLLGSAVTAVVMLFILQPESGIAQAQPTPTPSGDRPWGGPGMGGMMRRADRHFIVMMIPHHEGAIAMADLALERSQRPEIRTLAASIKETQTQEIEQMRAWYRQWYNADVPDWEPGMGWNDADRPQGREPQGQPGDWAPGMMGMHGRGWARDQDGWEPGMGCMGMRTMQGDLRALEQASDFDRAFIEEMIPHHQMAVMMSQMLLLNSDRPELQALAQKIIETQTTEINQMRTWYQAWYQ